MGKNTHWKKENSTGGIMPYTADTKERPRSEQARDPRTPGELTLAYTMACIEYIQNTKLNYEHLARCMAVLNSDAIAIAPKEVLNVVDLGTLQRRITWLSSRYADNAKHSNYQVDTTASKLCAQAEWYRRVITPYENKKIRENGDVFPQELVYGGQTSEELEKEINDAIQAVRKEQSTAASNAKKLILDVASDVQKGIGLTHSKTIKGRKSVKKKDK